MDNKLAIKLFKSVSDSFCGFSKKAAKYGIIMPDCPEDLVDYAISLYGKDGELYNSLFHKNFKTVAEASFEQLFFEQVFHYMTTYGTDFTSEFVYIPKEAFDIPGFDMDAENAKFVRITTATPEAILESIKTLCSMPLSQSTVKEVAGLIKSLKYEITRQRELNFARGVRYCFYEDLLLSISNKEVKCYLYEELGAIPTDPDEFLRYILFLATGSTLKIKNNAKIQEVKNAMRLYHGNYYNKNVRQKIEEKIAKYVEITGYTEGLGKIFKRDKNLLLAFKTHDTAKIFNKLNKLSKKMPSGTTYDKYVNHITDTSYPIEKSLAACNTLIKEIDGLSTRKLLALMKTVNYRMANPKFIEYRIRNGTSWLTDAPVVKDKNVLMARRNVILDTIVERLRPKFATKTFVIPENVLYAVPTSEKDFTGEIPNKTIVKMTNDECALVVAVCWDVECDIDLSICNEFGRKIGWNADLKSANGERCITMFSGDMTRLDPVTKKASEAMYIEGAGYFGTVKVNLFSRHYCQDKNIPFKFVIAKSPKLKNIPVNAGYSIKPEDVLMQVNMEFSDPNVNELTLGTISVDEISEDASFTFNSENSGSGIVSFGSKFLANMQQSIAKVNSESGLKLNSLIKLCGGRVVTPAEAEPGCIDLSFENLSKETLIGLIK